MDDRDDFYSVLGVSEEADNATIKRAWRQQSARYHPDAAVAGGAAEEAEGGHRDGEKREIERTECSRAERFHLIQQAYAVLSDPEKRRVYDEGAAVAHGASGDLSLELDNAGTTESLSPGSRLVGDRLHWLRSVPAGRFVLALAACMPWNSLVRVRTLAGAVLLGFLVLSLHLAGWRRSLSEFTVSGQFAESGNAVPEESEVIAKHASSNGTHELVVGRNAGQTAAAEIASGKQVLALRTGGEGDTRPVPGPAAERGISRAGPADTPGDKRIAEKTRSGMVPAAVHPQCDPTEATIADGIAASEIPSLGGAVAAKPLLPVGRHPGAGSWHQAWVAGCVEAEGQVIWTGSLLLVDDRAAFQWFPWTQSARERRLELIARPDPLSSGSRKLLFGSGRDDVPHAGPGAEPGDEAVGSIHLVPGGFAQLAFSSGGRIASPCREWHLTPVREVEAVVGRWLLPDARPQLSDGQRSPVPGIFPLEYLHLTISADEQVLRGHLDARYGARAIRQGRSQPASLSVSPSVKFDITATRAGFEGTFWWEQPSHGQGTLSVLPLGPSTLAIRWQADRLVPGKLHLSGGSAVLRRR